MTRAIIDMRCRPAYLHDFFGKTPGTSDYDVVRWLNRRVGTRGDDQHFTRSATPEGFLSEIRDAGLTRAVVVGRHTPAQHLPNDDIAEIVALDPARLTGIGAVVSLVANPVWGVISDRLSGTVELDETYIGGVEDGRRGGRQRAGRPPTAR